MTLTRRTRVFLVGAACLLLIAVLGATVQRSPAAFHGHNGRIAFESSGVICSINPSGSGLQCLTPHSDSFASAWPAFSPNGRKIAYEKATSVEPGSVERTGDLWTMGADGSRQRRLTRTPSLDEEAPAWSPNGRQIAFASSTGGRAGTHLALWVMHADGSYRHRLTRHGYGASWSPDGATIAYSGDSHVYVVPVHGGRPRNLTPGPRRVYARDPDWSPDGRWIAFSKKGDLWLMRANGSHQHPVTKTTGFDETEPAWSPDGRWISYVRVGTDGFVLYLIRPDGTDLHPINEAGSTDESPSWQPR